MTCDIIVYPVMNSKPSRPAQPHFVRDDELLSSQPGDLSQVAIPAAQWDAFMDPKCLLQQKAAQYLTPVKFFRSFSKDNQNRDYVGMNDGEILFWLDEAWDEHLQMNKLSQNRWLKIINALQKNHAKVLFLRKEGVVL